MTEEKKIEEIAIDIATKGEKENIGALKFKCDWREFGKFVGIWLITALVLFCALIIITMVKGSTNILGDTIREVDTLNMMFSLVLSALLEQIWSKNGRGGLYSFTLGAEGLLAFIGSMLFMAYSIIRITSPDNQLLELSFSLNLGYIVVSTIVVLLGFFSRAISEKI